MAGNIQLSKARTFALEFTAYWRQPVDTALKLAIIIGLLLHASFFISIRTGWWDTYFVDSARFESRKATDFFAIYLAGHELLRGRTIYTIERERPEYKEAVPYFDPFRYLPVAAYLGVPLNALSPWAAYKLWIIFYEFLFFISILWLGHHIGTMRGMHVAAALYLFFTPWYPEIYMGQYSFLQSVLILGMLISAANGQFTRAGGWWAASVLWKLNTGICLPAILRWRLWKPILWLMGILVVTCGPYFIFHPDDIVKFFLINFREPGPAFAGNFGFQGLIAKIFHTATGNEEYPAQYATQYITMAVFILISLWATIRAKQNKLTETLCLWVAAYFLVYIDVWEHQYVMLLPVIAILYLKRPGIVPWLIWFVLACPTTYKYFYDILLTSIQAGNPIDMLKDTSFWNDWHFTLIKPIGLLGLWVYCLWATIGSADIKKIRTKRVG